MLLLLRAKRPQTPQSELMNNFISGSVGGFIGTAINTPCVSSFQVLIPSLTSIRRFDVCGRSRAAYPICDILRRSSNRAFKARPGPRRGPCRSTTGPTPRALTLLRCMADGADARRLATIFREEGPKALYKGFVPKVLRLAPGGGVLLLVVEFTLDGFRKGAWRPWS